MHNPTYIASYNKHCRDDEELGATAVSSANAEGNRGGRSIEVDGRKVYSGTPNISNNNDNNINSDSNSYFYRKKVKDQIKYDNIMDLIRDV